VFEDFSGRFAIQPNGPFAALIFHNDGLGDHVGLIYLKAMGAPIDGKWGLDNRFWQAEAWSGDATSLAWGTSGKYVYIATAGVLGTGRVYRIDLLNQSSVVVFPAQTDRGRVQCVDEGSVILAVDSVSKVMKIKCTTAGTQEPFVKDIPFE